MNQPFRIAVAQYNGVARVAIGGEIDLLSAPAIRAAVAEQLARPETTGVVLDLTEVSFLDSSGIGVLLACKRSAAGADRPLRVTGATGLPAQILEMTGVAEYLSS